MYSNTSASRNVKRWLSESVMLGVVKCNHHGREETRRYNLHCSPLSLVGRDEHAELLYQKCVGSSTTVNGSAKLTPVSAQSFIISLIHLECVGPNSVITLVWLQSEEPCCRALPTHSQFKNRFIDRCLFKFRWLHSALQSDVFSKFCAYCSYCSFNFTFYFV